MAIAHNLTEWLMQKQKNWKWDSNSCAADDFFNSWPLTTSFAMHPIFFLLLLLFVQRIENESWVWFSFDRWIECFHRFIRKQMGNLSFWWNDQWNGKSFCKWIIFIKIYVEQIRKRPIDILNVSKFRGRLENDRSKSSSKVI